MRHIIKKQCLMTLLAVLALLCFVPLQVFATTQTVLDGKISVTDTANSNSLSGSTVTIQAKGGMFSKKTNTVTITNETDSRASVGFDYSASKYNSFTIAGSSANASGTHNAILDAGGTVTVVIQSNSGLSNTTATLTLSNFSYKEVTANAAATVTYDTAKGSVSMGGSAVVSGGSATATGGQLAAVATPASGCSFLGWVNLGTHEILSTAASTTLSVPQNMNVQAVFINNTSDTAWFNVDSKYLTSNLTTASSLGTKIVLANNGTLSGTHTLASGDTLLIPRDSAGTVNTTKPDSAGNSKYYTTSIYRKLTMAQGASITVNGAISIGGQVGSHMQTNDTSTPFYTNGAPSGPLGYIDMNNGSSITVNSGGNLYAWGFVTGSGAITVKSGGNVYEDLQLRDYRGGDATSSMIENGSRVFPFNQYYIQNIEVPLTLEAGAKSNVCMTVDVTVVGVQRNNAVFIGGSGEGLIRLTSGSITRDYDGSKDRVVYDLNGTVSFGNLNVSIKVSFLDGAITINSEDYVMPINSNMTLNVNAGSVVSMNQDLALLPGAVVNIAEGATCTVGTGNRLFVYDQDAWVTGYASLTGKLFNPVYFAPSKTYDRTSADLIDVQLCINGTLDATNGYVYTTTSGANICSNANGKLIVGALDDTTKTYQGKQSGETVEYIEIPITPAKLKNADGSYLTSGTNTYTYDSTVGAWRCAEGKHTDADNDHVCDVCYLDPCSECVDTDPADHNCDVCGKEALTECKDDDNNAVCDICGTSLCAHDWVDANCDTPKTCSKCGATDGDPLDHNYESTTVDATCMEDGSTTYTCSACGDTYSEPISALGHTASGGWLSDGTSHYKLCGVCGEATDTEACSGGMATCTAQATCKVCGKLYGTTLAHDYKTTYTYDETNHWYKCNNCSATTGIAEHSCVAGEPVSPTCTEAGYTTYTCECGYSYQGDTVAATNHKDSLTQHEAKAPTCTTVGWEAYEDCSKCTYSTYTEIPATGHTEVIDEAVAATCTTTGLTQGKHCSVCNAVITAQQTVNALGHTEVIDQAVAATCLTTGLTEGKHCSVCSEVLVSQTVTDKLAHTEEEIPAVAATCTQKGLTAGAKCSVCGTVITAPTETPMIDHTPVADAAKAPSCTEIGLTEGSHCESCGETIVAQETVDALGHKEVIDKAVDATCAATGLTEGKHCSVCGEVLVAQQIVSKTEVHTWSSGICTVCGISSENVCVHEPDENKTAVVKPTCIAAGSTTYTCSICELTYVGATADALGHTAGAEATCTEDQTCTVCGTVIAKATGHNYAAVVTAPTCTAEGYTTHTCSNCNNSYKDSYTDRAAHTPGAAVEEKQIAATCTVAGSYDTVTYCTVCNAEQSRVTTTIPAPGHQMDAEWTETKAPTCTENGVECKYCANCDHYEMQSIAAMNHDLPEEWTVVKEATCTASGEQKRECSRCDYVETESIDKIAHTYEEAVTPPTCTEAGYTTYTCTKCGDTYTGDEVENLGHTAGTAVRENITNPGCGTTGSYDSVEYCTICNTEMSRTLVTTDATGNHNYGDGVETRVATCTADGVMTYTCTACGATKTEAIEAQGHDKVEHEAKTPTCINIGWDAYVTCNRCDYTTYAEKPATGKHSDSAEDTDHICDTEGCTKGMNDCSDTENDGDHKCDICSKEAVSEHISAEAVVENNVPATCGSAGHYDSVVYCSECNTELSRETITVNATNNHSYSSSVTKEATCIDDGVRTFTCSRCGNGYTEVIPATGKHSWNDATYTAPKTCSVCGAKEGEPLVDVTEQPEDVTDEQINAAVGAIDGVINTVQPDDHGFEADANKDIVTNAKDDIQLETGATATDYEAILKITMNAVVVDTGSIVTKITYDVTPILYAKDADGKVVGSTAMTSFEEEIAFRLPVDTNTSAGYARVHHTHNGQTIDMGLHKIHTNGDHKYVEVKSKEFSEYTVEIEDADMNHIYGTNGLCTLCGVQCPYYLGQTSQIWLIEPWALRANLKLYHWNSAGTGKSAQLTASELNEIDDFGVYFIRESDLGMGDVTQNDVTVEDIINHPDVLKKSNQAGAKIDTSINAFSSDFDEGIYTYQLSDSIYVLYFIVEDGHTYYAPIRERNLSQMVKTGMTDTATYGETACAVLAKMHKLETDILEYRGGAHDSTLEIMDAPTLGEYAIGAVIHSMKFGHTMNISVVEPWGIQFNGKVALNQEYDDYGVVIYYDTGDTITSELTPESLLAISDAYVFSWKNGDATIGVESDGRTRITALYNSGLYTYQMKKTAYVMFYVQDGDNLYCGEIKERSIESAINARLGMSGVAESIEGTVLQDMLDLYEVTAKHRGTE